MFLSYCVVCMNRLWQLKETLPYNLCRLKDDEEICLVNYNSTDGMDEWVKNNFMDYINKGTLVYFYTKEPEYFHASKSKNVSNRLACGEWHFTLDADNFISESTREVIDMNSGNFFIWEHSEFPGTFGRIAVKKKDFYAINGYEESFEPAGYQDMDFIKKLKKLKIKQRRNKCNVEPIINNKDETIKNTEKNMSWEEMNITNKNKSILMMKNNMFTNNKNGMCTYNGILNFSEEITL